MVPLPSSTYSRGAPVTPAANECGCIKAMRSCEAPPPDSMTTASWWFAKTTARTKPFLREVCVLLALDAGNTNVTIGAFEFGKLTATWRLRTVHEQTADEWGVLLRTLLQLAAIHFEKVDAIVIASVVPPID